MRHTTLVPALVGRSMARAAVVAGAVGGLLAGFQVLLVLVATSFQQTRSFDLLTTLVPMTVQRTLGPGTLMLATFPGMVTFGYFHPIVVLAVVLLTAYVATEPAGEVEWGLFDLELARPLARHWVMTRSLVLALGLGALIVCAMVSGSWIGLALFAPKGADWPAARTVGRLALHLTFLAWCFGAAGLASAAFARRRGAAFAVVALGAVFFYLLNFIADVWEPASRLRWISPFHYFPGFAVASLSASTVPDVLVLAAMTAGLAGLAYWQFGRRDL